MNRFVVMLQLLFLEAGSHILNTPVGAARATGAAGVLPLTPHRSQLQRITNRAVQAT